MCVARDSDKKEAPTLHTNRVVSNRCFSDARPEGCATDPSRWRHWNDKVKRWAADADKHHVIAANNQYDARYIRHFSGVPAEAIPSYCDKGFSYAPSRGPVLLSMAQRVENALVFPQRCAFARQRDSNHRIRVRVDAFPRLRSRIESSFHALHVARAQAVCVACAF